MSFRWNTAERNSVLSRVRSDFEDGIINIYSGTAPTSPDLAKSGTLLLSLTKSGAAVTAGTRSTAKVATVQITNATQALLYGVKITINGNAATNYDYLNPTPTVGNANAVAMKLAAILNDVPGLNAIAAGCTVSGDAGWIFLTHEVAGETFTVAATSSEGDKGGVTIDDTGLAAVDLGSLNLGPVDHGVIAKDTGQTWSGTAVATGTAGYWRLVTSMDDAAADTAHTQKRIQGNCGISGTEMTMVSTSIVDDVVYSINTFSLELPELQTA